jgi:HK97 gp10 family phage protein
MPNDVKFTLNLDTEGAKAKIREAILAGVTEVFELDIKPEAVNLSPYITGTNRRLIDEDVVEVPEGVQATLYGQSGYSGYLELGTVKMKAQPYLWPAFNQFVSKIFDVVKSKLRDTP